MRRPIVGSLVLGLAVASAVGLLVVGVVSSIWTVQQRAPVTFEATRRAVAMDSIEDRGAVPDILLTSHVFRPTVTFRIAKIPSRSVAEFCFLRSSATEIVLQHLMGCVDEVRIIHPSATDCGGLDPIPDSARLAAAMLSRPGLGAVDLGPIAVGDNVPAGLFDGPIHGRVIDVPGDGRGFDESSTDPDRCRLLFGPDADPAAVEIRHDMTDRFVLVDHRDELFVIRAGTGGHDAASGKDAHQRGYGNVDPAVIEHMLESIEHIGFD